MCLPNGKAQASLPSSLPFQLVICWLLLMNYSPHIVYCSPVVLPVFVSLTCWLFEGRANNLLWLGTHTLTIVIMTAVRPLQIIVLVTHFTTAILIFPNRDLGDPCEGSARWYQTATTAHRQFETPYLTERLVAPEYVRTEFIPGA